MVALPEAVLRGTGPLTDAQWDVVREHPLHGERMVRRVAALEDLGPAIRAEHERFDGGGYPDGLAGTAIPMASRIVLACDAWHAMRSDRSYRPAMTWERARDELVEHAGTQFDPQVVGALLLILDEGLGVAGTEPVTGATDEGGWRSGRTRRS